MMADVAGYSRIMGEHEERRAAPERAPGNSIDALLGQHRGRIFNTPRCDPGRLPERSGSPVRALPKSSAVRTRNEHLPEDQRMWFRIASISVRHRPGRDSWVMRQCRGAHPDRAEPASVHLWSVYDQIQNKLSLQFRPAG